MREKLNNVVIALRKEEKKFLQKKAQERGLSLRKYFLELAGYEMLKTL